MSRRFHDHATRVLYLNVHLNLDGSKEIETKTIEFSVNHALNLTIQVSQAGRPQERFRDLIGKLKPGKLELLWFESSLLSLDSYRALEQALENQPSIKSLIYPSVSEIGVNDLGKMNRRVFLDNNLIFGYMPSGSQEMVEFGTTEYPKDQDKLWCSGNNFGRSTGPMRMELAQRLRQHAFDGDIESLLIERGVWNFKSIANILSSFTIASKKATTNIIMMQITDITFVSGIEDSISEINVEVLRKLYLDNCCGLPTLFRPLIEKKSKLHLQHFRICNRWSEERFSPNVENNVVEFLVAFKGLEDLHIEVPAPWKPSVKAILNKHITIQRLTMRLGGKDMSLALLRDIRKLCPDLEYLALNLASTALPLGHSTFPEHFETQYANWCRELVKFEQLNTIDVAFPPYEQEIPTGLLDHENVANRMFELLHKAKKSHPIWKIDLSPQFAYYSKEDIKANGLPEIMEMEKEIWDEAHRHGSGDYF